MRAFIAFIVLVVVAIVVFFVFWSRVPDAIAGNLSKKLQVQVSIGDMKLAPKMITVDKFQIGNPTGYNSLPKAFSADTIEISAPLTEYLNKNIVIEEVHIDNIYLGLEFNSINGTEGNWTMIMARFQNATEQGQRLKSGQKSVLIRKLVFTNINTYLVFAKESSGIKKLPKIDRLEFYDVSSEGGIPSDQLLNSVLGQMLKSVFEREHLKNMLKGILENPQDAIDNTLKLFKGLFGIYRNNLNNRFLTSSVVSQNSDLHSRLAHEQWSLAPDQNFERPPCQIPDSSGCFDIYWNKYADNQLIL